MNRPSYGDRDPVYAIATPLAESALAIIRTSGSTGHSSGAIELLSGIFSRPKALLEAEGNSVIHGWILEPPTQKKIDEVLVSVYRSPKSYTGEDAADISCHGGIAAVRSITSALKDAGFREALPGEFTFRAFMNGKLDLTRAESVMEIVSAKSHRGREQALRRLAGALEEEILAIKNMLVEVLASAEVYLDYSEDEFLDPDGDEEVGRLPKQLIAEEAAARLKKLSELWRLERIYSEGVLAVLAGKPNAGKSSLFNYLLRDERSIVTEKAGTTRDWIEAAISVEGILLKLADTAGLRSSNSEDASYAGMDSAERIGVERSLDLLSKADLVLYVIDGARGMGEDDRDFLQEWKKNNPEKLLLVLWNKADLAKPDTAVEDLPEPLLSVSAKTGEGITELLHSISNMLEAASGKENHGLNETGPGTVRQKDLIDQALARVEEALDMAGRNEALDVIAPLFRSAVNSLGEITGEVFTEDILQTIFSRFCVGK